MCAADPARPQQPLSSGCLCPPEGALQSAIIRSTLSRKRCRRQHAAALPMARGAIDRRYAAMLRLLRRHLAVDLHAIGQLRISQSVGAPHGSREQSIPPPTPPLD